MKGPWDIDPNDSNKICNELKKISNHLMRLAARAIREGHDAPAARIILQSVESVDAAIRNWEMR